MKRLLNGLVVGLALVLLIVFVATGAARMRVGDAPPLQVQTGERNPWTNLDMNNRPGTFRFAVISDRTGGHRPGIFGRSVRMINMLQPEFVMSVGDLIEGYSEDPGQWRSNGRSSNRSSMRSRCPSSARATTTWRTFP